MEQISKIIKAAEKYGSVEAAIISHSASSIVYEHNNLSNTNSGATKELRIRISNGRRLGFSQTTNLNNWEDCVKNAYGVMKASNPIEQDIVPQQKMKYPKLGFTFSKKIDRLSKEQLLDTTKDMMRAAISVEKKINIPHAETAIDSVEASFANSNGVNVVHRANVLASSIETTIGEVSGYDTKISHSTFDAATIGVSAAKLNVSSLNPKPVQTMKADLILDYFAVSEIIHTILIPAFTADNVQAGRSFLIGKLGKMVFSPKLSIEDNAILKNGLFSRPFDFEGSAGQRTILTNKGVIKNFLYDNYSARKDKVKSTGNCAGLQKVPYVGVSNFVIAPGKHKREQIINETKKGILATSSFGSHVANVLTGDISVGVSNAFYIENGEIVHPIKQAMVSFNLFEALKNVQMIGKEMRQDSEVAAPILRFDNVQVIGS